MKLRLKSEVFLHNGTIPDKYTCEGKNISPPLSWKNVPEETKSFALIMQDLDTPVMSVTHWILYNIPSEDTKLSEDIPLQETFSNGMVQAKNSMRKNTYMGPCPLFGKHRYSFTLYALDMLLDPYPKMNKRNLLKKIDGHVLARSELLGFYSKSKENQ